MHKPMPEGLRAIADPHRWQLLEALAHSDLRVNELSSLLGARQNLVSYHLRELLNAGLLSAKRSSHDGRDTYYRLDVDRLGNLLCLIGADLDPGLHLGRLRAARQPIRPRKLRVLFLCTGNSARSQMAQALLTHNSGDSIEARSAGTSPKSLHPMAVEVMRERGLDISAQSSKHVRRYARTRFEFVITLCDKVREICPEFPGQPESMHWSIVDPSTANEDAELTYQAFERVAVDLETRIDNFVSRCSIPQGESAHAR